MKKTTLIVNIVLALAIIGLYVLYFTDVCKSSSGIQEVFVPTGEAAPEGSVVYIQIDSLVNNYDMFHDLRGDLEKKAKAMEEDLTKRGKDFERSVNDYREKAQKMLITRSQAEQTEQQLAQKQQELAAYSERLRNELAEEEAVMLRQIYDAVVSYLKEYNKGHNYSLIINTSASSNTILLGHPSLDITQDVLRGLNASYVRPKK